MSIAELSGAVGTLPMPDATRERLTALLGSLTAPTTAQLRMAGIDIDIRRYQAAGYRRADMVTRIMAGYGCTSVSAYRHLRRVLGPAKG